MSTHPFQVFIFDHVELDMTEFVPFRCRGPLSFYRAAVAYDDQICELCRSRRKHGYCYTVYEGCKYEGTYLSSSKKLRCYVVTWLLVSDSEFIHVYTRKESFYFFDARIIILLDFIVCLSSFCLFV